MDTEQRLETTVEVHASQIADLKDDLAAIKEDTRDIRSDIKTVLPIVAEHAAEIGALKFRVEKLEGQINIGKIIAGLATAAAAYLGLKGQ